MPMYHQRHLATARPQNERTADPSYIFHVGQLDRRRYTAPSSGASVFTSSFSPYSNKEAQSKKIWPQAAVDLWFKRRSQLTSPRCAFLLFFYWPLSSEETVVVVHPGASCCQLSNGPAEDASTDQLRNCRPRSWSELKVSNRLGAAKKYESCIQHRRL